jgi:phenylacetic acid degradation operon negative regulatory protein
MTKKITKIQLLRDGSLSQNVFYVISAAIKDSLSGALKLTDAYVNLFGGEDFYNWCHRFNYSSYYKEVRKKIKKEWEIKKAIKYLAQKRYIKLNKEKQRIYLAEKGFSEFIRFKALQKQGKWDGKWRVIIFDVAEERRNNRDFLRTRLKWLGFKELQKSVWVFPYDIKKDIEELMEISKYNCRGDIRFLTVEKIGEDNDLKKWFGLV